MKSRKYLKELREKSIYELESELVSSKKELFNLKFQAATNQLENMSRIRVVKKNIARILMLIGEEKNNSRGDKKQNART